MDEINELIRCERMTEVMRLAEDRSIWRSNVAKIKTDMALR